MIIFEGDIKDNIYYYECNIYKKYLPTILTTSGFKLIRSILSEIYFNLILPNLVSKIQDIFDIPWVILEKIVMKWTRISEKILMKWTLISAKIWTLSFVMGEKDRKKFQWDITSSVRTKESVRLDMMQQKSFSIHYDRLRNEIDESEFEEGHEAVNPQEIENDFFNQIVSNSSVC